MRRSRVRASARPGAAAGVEREGLSSTPSSGARAIAARVAASLKRLRNSASDLEDAFLAIVHAAGLPEPLVNTPTLDVPGFVIQSCAT